MLPSDALVMRCYQIQRNDPNFEMVRMVLHGELTALKTIGRFLPPGQLRTFALNPTVDNLNAVCQADQSVG